jgi:lipopolysaccharide transport system ATP-binding protein
VYAVLNEVAGERVVRPEPNADHLTRKPIVKGAVYPCAYLTREQLEAASPPKNRRIFVVIRDLRDTLISQYFSVRYSHEIFNPGMQRLRDKLSELDLTQGLIYLMKRRLFVSANIQRSWINSPYLLIKYEDLNRNELEGFKKIFAYCNIPAGNDDISAIIAKHSFAERAGRKRGEEDIYSHHRKGIVGDWRNYFNSELTDRFKEHFGELLIKTNYESDMNWQP